MKEEEGKGEKEFLTNKTTEKGEGKEEKES